MDVPGVQIVTEADTKKGGPMRTDMSDTSTKISVKIATTNGMRKTHEDMD